MENGNGKYDSLKLRNQLSFPLYLCSKEISRLYAGVLSGLDLTYTQYIVMMFFWEMGSSNVRELGQTLRLDPSTLTPVLKKLEGKGYIDRERSSQDERVLTVTLTEKGRELREQALGVPVKMRSIYGLTDSEWEALAALSVKLLENIEKEK